MKKKIESKNLEWFSRNTLYLGNELNKPVHEEVRVSVYLKSWNISCLTW